MGWTAEVSNWCGWGYVFAWSISFYGQLSLNYRRGSISGLRWEFVLANPLAFLCYWAYVELGVSREAALPAAERSFFLTDEVFAGHAFAISLLTLVQCWWLRATSDQTVSRLYVSLMAVLLALVLGTGAVSFATDAPLWSPSGWSVGTALYTTKVSLTLTKYIPQALVNWRRRSTEGWSMTNVGLDFTGGTLSFLQNFVLVAGGADWQAVFGNPGKVMLSVISVLFDLLFFAQYFAYGRGRAEPLLGVLAASDAGEKTPAAKSDGTEV